MISIIHKNHTLRKAIATSVLEVSKQETIDAVINKEVPKGDVFECSRAAGLLAVKKTSDVIPDCHPLPIEYAKIRYDIEGLKIIVTVEVHTIYKTGVEVEAMHGAAITALTMYDMLKPIDKNIVVGAIKLEEKKGGKSGFHDEAGPGFKCAVIVCSDSIAAGKKQDFAGKAIIEKLAQYNIDPQMYVIIADEFDLIQQKANMCATDKYDLLIFTGGTGLSPRDVTPQAIAPLITREIPGIMETARKYGQDRTPYAMLSRGIAGFVNDTLVLTLPGSTKGAAETMDALFPHMLHIFKIAGGARHEKI